MLCALALAPILHTPVHAQTRELTLAEAQKRALDRSYQLRGQDAAAQAARDLAVAARQLPDPMLKAGVDNIPFNGPDKYSLGRDNMTMRRIGIEQELPGAGKRALRGERYDRMAERTVAERRVAEAAIARDTALAWLDLYYGQQMTDVVDQAVRQADDQVLAQDAAFRGGRSTRGDLLAARSAAAQMRDRAATIHRQRENARDVLARWIGPASDAVASGVPDLTRISHNPDTLPEQLDHHPEVTVLDKSENLARTEARLAAAEARPDWRVEFAYQQRGPGYPDMVSFGVAVPLRWDRRNRQDREVAARVAMAEQAHAEREEALRMHAAEARSQIGDWRSGLARLNRYRTELMPLAQERVEAIAVAYRGGQAPLTDVLSARAAALDTRLQTLQLESETARLWARLNFLFPSNSLPEAR
ncbi:TolC family protein [Massilia arenosa]|uniref:TolC family protein n=2 Tax=Zemynaea arenosa TaxID=2561931 RepID=A0A4Y9RYV6_9BURK|nr:TolC family protein [Massilia arenosa]